MEALIGASATILAGLIGALLTWLAMRDQVTRQESKDKNKLKLEKLEELHQMLGRYPETLHSAILTHERDLFEGGLRQLIPEHLMPERPEFSCLCFIESFKAKRLATPKIYGKPRAIASVTVNLHYCAGC